MTQMATPSRLESQPIPLPTLARPAKPDLGSPFDTSVISGPASGEATLEGTLPPWLRGRLLRTAPAIFSLSGEAGTWSAAHWFDGLGMLYRLDLAGDKVSFAQRLLECEATERASRGEQSLASFGTRTRLSWLRRLFSPLPKLTDNANVHVIPLPDGWLAMTETASQLLIDGETLQTREKVTYDDAIGSRAMMLAHPEHDRNTNELINLAISIGRKVKITAYRQKIGTSIRTAIGTIERNDVPYIHSFGLTPTKIVVIAQPLRANPLTLLWSSAGYIDHFKWLGQQPTDIYLIDRATGAIVQSQCEPFFFFHTVNAFDDGDDVVLDLCAADDARLVNDLRLANLANSLAVNSNLRRLRIHRQRSSAALETVNSEALEFPAFNRAGVGGRRHALVWGASLQQNGDGLSSQILRLDLERSEVIRHAREQVIYGEPIFVRRPGATAEDDGVLLSVGSDLARKAAELVILDARTLGALATARLPIAIPLGFHGSFARAPEISGD